jgi:hypothetical protein
MAITRTSSLVVYVATLVACLTASVDTTMANEQPLAVGVDADTMIALDTNSNALPPPVGSSSTGAFGTGLEQANPLGSLPMTMRGGNAFDTGSLSAKPLIRFNLGPTAGVHIDPTLPYFLELTTQTDANSNDTFRIYSITNPATRSFNEATLTWDNAPAVATASKQDYEAAGNEAGVFYRPSTIDVAGTSIGHPLMGSQISTFASGANTFATFGLSGTGTNRWIITDKTSTKPSRLITYDVVESASSGALTDGGTWAGAANQANTLYRVSGGRTVTVDASAFAGKGVVVGNHATALAGDFDGNGSVGPEDYTRWKTDFGTIVGTAGSGADGNANGVVDAADYTVWRDHLGTSATVSTLNFTANNVDLPLIVINADGQIANGTGTSLSIGSPTPTADQVHAGGASGSTVKGTTGGLIINRDLTYTATVGAEDLAINVPLISYHDFTFNGVANSDLKLRFPAGDRGKINFNGAGNEVIVSENEGIGGTLVMNASGTNALAFEGKDSEQEAGKGTVIFNHAGSIDHRSDADHLQGVSNLVANAPVTINLSKTFPVAGPQTDERTFEVTRNLSGSAPITVQGTTLAPTGTGNTNNQFQIGVSTGAFTNVLEVDYAGTISTQGYAELDARAGMPKAKVVVNRNGILATGFEPHVFVPDQASPTTKFGEINVAAESSSGVGDGGTLEIGYLESTTGNGNHAPQNLLLTKGSGQNGNLTLGNGTSLVMQINGPPNYVPPQPGDPGNCSDPRESACHYDGPAFDTIAVEGLATLDGKLVVRLNPDVPFQAEASDTPPADPDYFPPTVGDTWDIIKAINGGSITGTFDTVQVIDTLNDLTPTQTFQVLYTSPTLVQLRLVDTAGSGLAATVPEPSSMSLALLTTLALCIRCRRRC